MSGVGAQLRALATPQRGKVALALGIGTIGALIAHQLHVPLAFMLGSLFATMGACLARAPIAPPLRLRSYFFIVIGLFLSEGFSSDIVSVAIGWWPSLILAALYPILVGAGCYLFYLRMKAMSPVDSLFSAIPGGLSGVVLVSGEFGADERKVALSHALRISMIVLAAPFFFFGLLGYSEPSIAVSAEDLINWGDAAILFGAAIAGALIFQRLGVPLPQLLAPLLVGALLRIFGVVDGALPELLVEVALIVVGASIGARFSGVRMKDLYRLAAWTAAGTALMTIATVLFALLASATTDVDILPAILAFAPGGVAEMTLISIALESDPAYVAAHHLARIGFILACVPFAAPFLARWTGLERNAEEQM